MIFLNIFFNVYSNLIIVPTISIRNNNSISFKVLKNPRNLKMGDERLKNYVMDIFTLLPTCYKKKTIKTYIGKLQ